MPNGRFLFLFVFSTSFALLPTLMTLSPAAACYYNNRAVFLSPNLDLLGIGRYFAIRNTYLVPWYFAITGTYLPTGSTKVLYLIYTKRRPGAGSRCHASSSRHFGG
ncbi:hypothetical protein V8C37DRAFT_378644 [Trichoderma ceciliae]